MHTQPASVELRQQRDFGACINDTNQFVRENWKNLTLLYLFIVVPILLVAVLLSAGGLFTLFTEISRGLDKVSNPATLITPKLFAGLLLHILAATLFATLVYTYMRLYDAGGRQRPAFRDVLPGLPKICLLNIGYALLILASFMLLAFAVIVPILGVLVFFFGFVYLAVHFSLVLPVSTIERPHFPAAINRCFQLIRHRWWYVFGYVIVLFLIYYFFAMVIGVFTQLAFGVGFMSLKDNNISGMLSRKYFLVTGFSSIVQQVFYLIIHVGMGILYFSLAEEKDGGGLDQRLDRLGSGTENTSGREEQY